MKITKNYFLAYMGKNIIVDVTENSNSEIFPAKNVEIAEFDSKIEADTFIKDRELTFHNQ